MKVELQQNQQQQQQQQQQRHLPTTKNGTDLPLDITSLHYHHTDDQKLRATTTTTTNTSTTSNDTVNVKESLVAPSYRATMPLDLLEPCGQHSRPSNTNQPSTLSSESSPALGSTSAVSSSATTRQQQLNSSLDPDIVRQPVTTTRADISATSSATTTSNTFQIREDISPEQATVLLQPLTEAALIRRGGSGVDLMADIPMIDEDADEPIIGSNQPEVSAACSSDSSEPPRPLKSALKKGARPLAKKGLRVCFQNSSIFYIDTDAEANAEPQLLIVQSLELPQVSSACTTDLRQLKQPAENCAEPDAAVATSNTTTTTTTGSSGLEKKYTYEDAIVSLEHYSDILGPERGALYTSIVDKVRLGADTPDCAGAVASTNSGATPVVTTITRVEQDVVKPIAEDGNKVKSLVESEQKNANADIKTVEPSTGSTVKPAANEKSANASTVGDSIATDQQNDSDSSANSVQTLTVANLRLHEIMMEPDEPGSTDSDSREVQELQQSTTGALTTTPAINTPSTTDVTPEKFSPAHLSPPLKELTVDVLSVDAQCGAGGVSGRDGGANWQVELSPLNSIPESESESSNSSQDTIILMTSEESERNEQQIRRSLVARQQQQHQQNGSTQNDAATSFSSDSSDDTVKCLADDDASSADARTAADELRPSTASSSSEIRLIMERNAVRRSQLRYSNTKKKTDNLGANSSSSSSVVEKQQQQQRAWKSQESLLDTIKLLTSDDDERVENNHHHHPEITNASTHRHHHRHGGQQQDQQPPPPRLLNGSTRTTDNNLSLQDIRGLIAASTPLRSTTQGAVGAPSRSASTTAVAVPGDIRQWKIQANLWASVRGQQQRQLSASQQITPTSQPEDEQPRRVSADTRSDCSSSAAPSTTPAGPSEEEDQYGYYGANGYFGIEEGTDELARFVHNDSDRLERLRKRYSYTDGEEYDSSSGNSVNNNNFGSRRPSVRGIKPRFGSTSEILKQMQGLLHTPPLASTNNLNNNNGHLTWPYPADRNGGTTPATSNQRPATTSHHQQQHTSSSSNHQHHHQLQQPPRHSNTAADSWMTSTGNYATLPTSFSGGGSAVMAPVLSGSRSVASLPTLREEIYGVVRARPTRDGTYIQVCATPAQSTNCPPPYQPPPPAPSSIAVAQHPAHPPPYDHPHYHNNRHSAPVVLHHQPQHYQHHVSPYPNQQPHHQYHNHHHHHHHQTNTPTVVSTPPGGGGGGGGDRMPMLMAARPHFVSHDERGVPEGASASPKVTFDSLYAHVAPSAGGKSSPVPPPQSQPSQAQSGPDNSGVVYYAMQV